MTAMTDQQWGLHQRSIPSPENLPPHETRDQLVTKIRNSLISFRDKLESISRDPNYGPQQIMGHFEQILRYHLRYSKFPYHNAADYNQDLALSLAAKVVRDLSNGNHQQTSWSLEILLRNFSKVRESITEKKEDISDIMVQVQCHQQVSATGVFPEPETPYLVPTKYGTEMPDLVVSKSSAPISGDSTPEPTWPAKYSASFLELEKSDRDRLQAASRFDLYLLITEFLNGRSDLSPVERGEFWSQFKQSNPIQRLKGNIIDLIAGPHNIWQKKYGKVALNNPNQIQFFISAIDIQAQDDIAVFYHHQPKIQIETFSLEQQRRAIPFLYYLACYYHRPFEKLTFSSPQSRKNFLTDPQTSLGEIIRMVGFIVEGHVVCPEWTNFYQLLSGSPDFVPQEEVRNWIISEVRKIMYGDLQFSPENHPVKAYRNG